MTKIIPEFKALLAAYARQELSFTQFHDELSQGLQFVFENSSEDGLDLLSEVLACIYEVEDGVMPEQTFRQAIQEFLAQQTPIPAAPAAVAD